MAASMAKAAAGDCQRHRRPPRRAALRRPRLHLGERPAAVRPAGQGRRAPVGSAPSAGPSATRVAETMREPEVSATMRLTFDDASRPSAPSSRPGSTRTLPDERRPPSVRGRVVADMPPWARAWQRRCSTPAGWCRATRPSSAAATPRCSSSSCTSRSWRRRRIYAQLQPAGPRHHRPVDPRLRHRRAEAALGGADPARRDHRRARHERARRRVATSPGCAPAPCSTATAFVVNGQKVWTSGAHDADVILTFVRTDPDAPKHKGISVLLIPTDTAGRHPTPVRLDHRARRPRLQRGVLRRRPRARGEPRRRAERRLARRHGSLGHERAMLWLSFVERLETSSVELRRRTSAAPAHRRRPRSRSTGTARS